MTKLSIITINFNNADGLQKTIKSVVGQTFKDYEYIIIDGGSTDGSIEIINNNKRFINYWVSEPDKGIYNAMNKGIEAAKSEYLLFLNSGDYLYKSDVLENVFNLNRQEDIVYGDFIQFHSAQRQTNTIFPDTIDFDFLTCNNCNSLPHTSSFIKRHLFVMVGKYNEALKIVSDWEFFLLAINKFNCSYYHLPMLISVFDMEGVSSDKQNEKQIEYERNFVLQKHFSSFVSIVQQIKQLRSFRQKVVNSLPYKLYRKIKSV